MPALMKAGARRNDARPGSTGARVVFFFRGTATLALCAALTACTSISAFEDQTVVASIRYDALSCEALAAERDALAARFGIDPGFARAPGEPRSPMVGMITPDLRGSAERERIRASRLVHAMNQSLERRRCGQES